MLLNISICPDLLTFFKSTCANETLDSNDVQRGKQSVIVRTLQDPNLPRFSYHFHFSGLCHPGLKINFSAWSPLGPVS